VPAAAEIRPLLIAVAVERACWRVVAGELWLVERTLAGPVDNSDGFAPGEATVCRAARDDRRLARRDEQRPAEPFIDHERRDQPDPMFCVVGGDGVAGSVEVAARELRERQGAVRP
jgi:hypothetical protein